MELLNRIQRELKAPKGKTNQYGGYRYRNCEDIFAAVKPLLDGATITINDSIEVIGDRYYVKAVAAYRHGETCITAQSYAREPQARKGMDDAQVTGSSSSYARKYALCALLMIDGEDDPDTTTTHGKEAAKQPRNAKPQQQPDRQTTDRINAARLAIQQATTVDELKTIYQQNTDIMGYIKPDLSAKKNFLQSA